MGRLLIQIDVNYFLNLWQLLMYQRGLDQYWGTENNFWGIICDKALRQKYCIWRYNAFWQRDLKFGSYKPVLVYPYTPIKNGHSMIISMYTWIFFSPHYNIKSLVLR